MPSNISNFSGQPASRQHTWTLAAYRNIARQKLARSAARSLQSLALKSWDIAPGERTITPPAICLPDQMQRVTGWESRFFPYVHPGPTMAGGIQVEHGPTRGYLLKDVWLIDGVLYKDNACLLYTSRCV